MDAPVSMLTLKLTPRRRSSTARFAMAGGTAFGDPAAVKPLVPIVAPEGMSAAASSADMILARNALFRMRFDMAALLRR